MDSDNRKYSSYLLSEYQFNNNNSRKLSTTNDELNLSCIFKKIKLNKNLIFNDF